MLKSQRFALVAFTVYRDDNRNQFLIFVDAFNVISKIVYPTGSMLEMSNGYPHSASPLGGSPSPGPSPGIGGHHNKCKHVTH